MLLAEINNSLVRIGYQPIGAAQANALLGALPDYPTWLHQCTTHERACPFWDQLRAAQFAVSEPCAVALARAELSPQLPVIVPVVVNQPLVRTALVRLYKQRGSARPDTLDVETVSKAFCPAELTTPPHRPPPPDAHSTDRSKWPIHKVHGARFAIAVEHTTGRTGRAVLQIEAADRAPQSRAWDWAGKIIVQLNDPEIIDFLAVLQGRSAKATFAHHGPHRDKSVELLAQPQSRNFMLAVRQGTTARAVPVPASHAFSLTTLALQVLRTNAPGLSASDVIALATSSPFATAPAKC